MSARIAVIINSSAGTGCDTEWAEELAGKFRASGLDPCVTLAHSGSAVIAAARSAVDDGLQMVVACGGDGTINAVASVLIGTGSALGVLPLGTLNHFARDMHIPPQLDLAVQAIVAGQRTTVDVGEVNGKYFLNNSSIGIYPDIVQEREHEQRRFGHSKWVAFFWASMKSLRRYPFLDVQLNADGQTLTRRTPFVFVGNNAYTIEGFDLGARKTLRAGHLSLYVAQRSGRLALLGFALRALAGRLRQARDFDALATDRLVIATRHKRIRVSTDGEVTLMQTPLRYRILAGALHVIVPVAAADATG